MKVTKQITVLSTLICLAVSNTVFGQTFGTLSEGDGNTTFTNQNLSIAETVKSVFKSAGYELVKVEDYQTVESKESELQQYEPGFSAIAIPAFIESKMETESFEAAEAYWLEKIAIPAFLRDRLLWEGMQDDQEAAIAIPNLLRTALEREGFVVVADGSHSAIAIPAFVSSQVGEQEVLWLEQIAIPAFLTATGN